MKRLIFCLSVILGFSNIVFGQLSAERQKFLKAWEQEESSSIIALLQEWGEKNPDNYEYRASQARFDYVSNMISLDSLISVLDFAIEASPRELDYRLDKVYHSSDSSSYYPMICKELVELNNTFQQSPVGWSLYGQTLTAEDFNQLFGDFSADILKGIAESGSIGQAEQFYNELMSAPLADDARLVLSYQMAESYSQAEKYNEAIEVFKKTLEKCDDSQRAAIQFNIALYYYYLDNAEEALKYAKLADEGGDAKAKSLIKDLQKPMQNASYYDFVFQLMPRLLSGLPVSDESLEVLQKPERFVQTLKQNKIQVDRDLSGITPSVVSSDLGNVVVWTMPEPKDLTEPKYIAFVPGKDGYKYYTYEKTLDFEGESKETPYILGGATYDAAKRISHFNTGLTIEGDCTPESLVKLIEQAQKQ